MNDYTAGYSVSDGFNFIYKNHQLKFGIYADLEMQHQPNHAGSGSFAGSFSFSNPNPSDPFKVSRVTLCGGIARLFRHLFSFYRPSSGCQHRQDPGMVCAG